MEHKNTETCADCKEREATPDCTCCQKKKERSDKEYRDLMNRLKRIEGQVRGIQGMLEKDAYCTDIMVQVAAVNAALNSFNKVLLTNHLHTCVAENIRAGNDEVIDELEKCVVPAWQDDSQLRGQLFLLLEEGRAQLADTVLEYSPSTGLKEVQSE